MFVNGNREQLEAKIRERYGIAEDQVRKEIEDWYSSQKWSIEATTAKVNASLEGFQRLGTQ
jgi:hypothetical protein